MEHIENELATTEPPVKKCRPNEETVFLPALETKKRVQVEEEAARKKSRVAQSEEEKGAKGMNSMWVFHANANGYRTHGIDIEVELEIMPNKTRIGVPQ